VKRLIVIYSDGRRVPVATFRIQGNRVVITETEEGAIRSFGLDGLVGRDKLLTPSDGLVYYDVLERAFSQSTYCYVDTVPDEHSPGLDGERS
jgi:hypothetical protein